MNFLFGAARSAAPNKKFIPGLSDASVGGGTINPGATLYTEGMVSRIQPLPDQVVHRIAAGEVIDSLAAVVRELAENAIDAGATRLTLSIWVDQWKVRLADNGQGMTPEELQQAATPHSTSKIRSEPDLWQITSLGFRGEALHSLAQLSDLEICSRTARTEEGWWVQYDHQGQPRHREVMAIAPGTVVTVAHLFGQWLPRRQNLPSPAQQLRAIQLTIQAIALCHPQITWQVEQGDRPWFSIWASPTARHILPQCLRDVQATDLQDLETVYADPMPDSLTAAATDSGALPMPSSRLSLVLGLPDRCHRHRPDWVKVAVNGRMVRYPELEQTLIQALRRTLPRDRYPVGFLHFHLPPQQVDWNRHPAKAEVFIRHLEHHQRQVTAAIARALDLSPAQLPDPAYRDRVTHLLKTAESSGAYAVNGSAAVDPQPLPGLKAIAQLHQMYIVAEHASGIWLIEQHIAHERVLYEQLRDRWQVVPLEPPLLLNALTPAQMEQLQRLGITVEPFGDGVWAVRSAPASLSQRQDCAEALIELSQGGNLDAALVATACRTAIRNGTPLSLEAMQTLLNQWQQTHHPRTCPHGRPICLPLAESSLSRYFRRHWVVGKSHGI